MAAPVEILQTEDSAGEQTLIQFSPEPINNTAT